MNEDKERGGKRERERDGLRIEKKLALKNIEGIGWDSCCWNYCWFG